MMDWNWIKDNCNVIVRKGKMYIELTPEIYHKIHLKLDKDDKGVKE